MGFFLFDYFRCEPFEFNFRLLVFNGFWPIETKNKILQKAFSIYSFLSCFSLISMLFIQILDLYLLRNDPLNLTKNLCATSVTFASVTKYLFMFYKVEYIEKLHKHLNELKKIKTNPEDQEILEKADRQIIRVTKAFYGLAVPCILTWMIYPGLESSEEHKVPFPYRLPIDDWSTPVYEILYVYQSMSMIGFMVIILSNDLIFYGMIIRVNAQYEMLIKKTEALEEIFQLNLNNNDSNEGDEGQVMEVYDPEITRRMRNVLRESVVFHQDILHQIDYIKIIYSTAHLFHLISAVTMVGVIIIDILMISKGLRLQMFQRIMYTANGVFDTYLICLFTSEMEEKSIQLFRTIYCLPWYRINPKMRKDLFIFAMRCFKPPVFKMGNAYPLNLSMFLQFLKITYNITALLHQTIRN